MKTIYDVLKRPIVTEKSSSLKTQHGQVVLEAARWANKHDIKKAARELFNVEVKTVQTMVVRGKAKRVGTSAGKRSNWKKAILTLGEGADLDAFGVVAEAPVPEAAQ